MKGAAGSREKSWCIVLSGGASSPGDVRVIYCDLKDLEP